MCGISGFTCLNQELFSSVFMDDNKRSKLHTRLYEILHSIFQQTCERGRDSWGLVGYAYDGSDYDQVVIKDKGVYSIKGIQEIYEKVTPDRVLLSAILNFRGEPTTEIVDRSRFNIQPFVYHGTDHFKNGMFAVAHNGIISNDKQILGESSAVVVEQRKQGNSGHIIDSYALLQQALDCTTDHAFDREQFFNGIEGSYALAMYLQDRTLLLARNYRDLAVRKIDIYGVPFLFFASKPQYLKLRDDWVWDTLDSVPAYSWIQVTPGGEVTTGKIDDGLNNQRKAVVVLSGGLDSTTAATIACRENDEVVLLHFLYDCKAESKEKDAVTKIHIYLQRAYPNVKVTLEFFQTDLFKKLGGSTITDEEMYSDIAKGDEGVETCSEWVPARNTVMCAIAAAYCDRYNIGQIYLGLNMEESGAFPDNTTEFYERMSSVTRVGTQARPRIVNPLGNLMKHEIVAKAWEVGAPLHLSWSCYHSNDQECHRYLDTPESEYCGPCTMKSRAFRMNNLTLSDFAHRLFPGG